METLIITKIVKTGNSLSVILPKKIMRAVNLKRGDHIVLHAFGDDIINMRKLSSEEIKNIIKY